MPRKILAIEQRRRQIAAQVERLRSRLASRTRKDYSTDFHYERWLAQSNALIDELLAELSVLEEPGEYDQLPAAVVAEELGTTTAKIRLLIKSGEILASGRPAHEYVSRDELAEACETGMKELTRRLNQEAHEIFEESVAYLHQGRLRLAEKACRRLNARESIAGDFALPYESALLLAKADLNEVEAKLRFIGRAKDAERARFLHNLRRILRGMSFQNGAAKAVAERLLQGHESRNVDGRMVLSSKLDETQQLATFITTVIFNEIDRRWKKHLRAGRREELHEIVLSAVYSSLHAHESYDQLASSKEFVNNIRALIPRYYKPATLLDGLVADYEKKD
jgi:hypothetical protein